MSSSQSKKKAQGRQKIEMKLIENVDARRSTSSKCRIEIFRKATELTSLCSVQMALIIFSICDMAYSFGNSCNESILGRLCGKGFMPVHKNPVHCTIQHESRLQQLQEDREQVSEEIESKRKRGEGILEKMTFKDSEEDLNRLHLVELKKVKEKMKRLKERMLHNQPRQEMKYVNGVNLGKVEMDGSHATHWLKL